MMISCDLHNHTPLCGHATGSPVEYVQAAAERGLSILGFACHIPMASEAFGGPKIRMSFDQVAEYQQIVREAATFGEELGVEVLCGIEAEYFPEPGELEAMDELLRREKFDYVLGSVHPHLSIYQRWFAENGADTDDKKIRFFWQHMTKAARCGRYDAITHPDVVRCHGTVSQFDPTAYEESTGTFLNALNEYGLCMEINSSGLFKDFKVAHPDPVILRWASQQNVPIVIGSDAHDPHQVAGGFNNLEPIILKHGWHNTVIFRSRQREVIPLNRTSSAEDVTAS